MIIESVCIQKIEVLVHNPKTSSWTDQGKVIGNESVMEEVTTATSRSKSWSSNWRISLKT